MIDLLGSFIRRALMFLAGSTFVGLEAYGSYEFLSEQHGKTSFMTLSGVAITAVGTSLLPLAAENARRNGRMGLKLLARLAVPLVFVFVFIASISRSGGSVDKDEIANAQLNEDIRIARAEEAEAEKQKLIDQVEVAKNCTPWGPKCQRAKDDTAATEAKLAAARAVLKVRGAEHSKGMTLRLAQYVRF